jgi:uncharacterized protein
MYILPIIFTVAAALAAAPDQKPQPQHVRVLLVTGVDHPAHLWKETAPAVRRVLEKDPRLEVRIVEDPEFLASAALNDYDVILLHFKNYKPLRREAEARENLAKLVKQGKGLVLLHFASGAFEDWPEFARLAGRVWDRKTSHDPRGPFTVKITDPEHPITRGMRDFQADDELYTCLVGKTPIHLLAVARSKTTGKDHPMAFTLDYGQGRVFHTPLGHDVRAIERPGVAELIRRGCLWTARVPLQPLSDARS